jgi:hypothetical protein
MVGGYDHLMSRTLILAADETLTGVLVAGVCDQTAAGDSLIS